MATDGGGGASVGHLLIDWRSWVALVVGFAMSLMFGWAGRWFGVGLAVYLNVAILWVAHVAQKAESQGGNPHG